MNRAAAWGCRLAALCLLLASAACLPGVQGRDPTTLTAVNEDGDVRFNDPGYTRDSAGNDIYVYYTTAYRGYIEWDISAIPDAAIIESVSFRYRRYSAGYASAIDCYQMSSQPSASSDATVYADAKNGVQYLNGFGSGNAADTWYTVALPASAAAHLQANLAADWFALGFYASPSVAQLYSENGGYTPEVIIQWHLAGDYAFYFDDAVYENATDAGAVTVTAVIPSGSEDFTVDGADWWYSPEMPTSFHWSIGAATRVVCVVEEENFTVTLPDDDYSSYGLAVRDYTGKLGLGTAYLESYRSIGGVDVLTQRAKITVGAATPMTLVVYKLYHLYVLWADDTRYDAGYYTPGVDTSTDIYVFGVAFSDQAQVTYKYLTVEAIRPSPTQITVNYQDTLNQTTWCNVTIMTMDRVTVYQAQGTGGVLQFNWLSAVAGTDYTVYVVIDHEFFEWYPSEEWVLQGAYAFPAFIPLPGSVGGVTAVSIVGWFMVAVSAATFSKRDAELGLWAGTIMAALMWMVAGWFGAAELGIVASLTVAYTVLKRSGVL